MSENYIDAGYLADGYIQNTTGLIFDPSGISVDNAFTDEVHSSITEPAIWPTKGPIYGQSLVITGIKASDSTAHTLQLNTDYFFSPVFNIATSLTGFDAYAYIVLADYANWTSVSLSGQAVGLTDTFLLQEIVSKGNFDRSVVNNWLSPHLVGDMYAFASGDYSEGLKNSAVAYILARQMNALSSALSAPSSYLDFINGEFSSYKAIVDNIKATVESWTATFNSTGLLSGPTVTSDWVINEIASAVAAQYTTVNATWVTTQISNAIAALSSTVNSQISTALSTALNSYVTTSVLSGYVSASSLATTLSGYATTTALNSVIKSGWVVQSLSSVVPAGYLAMPTASTLVNKLDYPALYAVYADAFTPVGNTDNTKFGLPYMPPGVSMVSGTLGNFTVPSVYYSTGGTLQQGTPNNLGAGINTKFLIKI